MKFSRANFTFISLLCSLIFLVSFLLGNVAIAATFDWVQTGWTGGADTVATSSHPTNKTGWTKFYSASNISTTGGLSLTATNAAATSTSDTHFNAGTLSTTVVNGTGDSAYLSLATSVVQPSRVGYAALNNASHSGSGASDSAISGNYAYVADSSFLAVVNISNPASPTASWVTLPGTQPNIGIDVSGNYAYVAKGSDGLAIVDISNPASPVYKSTYSCGDIVSRVKVIGNLAYISCGGQGLRIANISNPLSATAVGFYNTGGTALDTVIDGNYAYIADGDNGLVIVNISNPASPQFVRTFDASASVLSVSKLGNYVYCAVSGGPQSLKRINVTDPANPSYAAADIWNSGTGWGMDTDITGNYLYLARATGGSTGSMYTFDISNPLASLASNPPLLWTSTWTPNADRPRGITVSGSYAYVSAGAGGYQIFLKSGFVASGNFTSAVIDTVSNGFFGAVTWNATTPASTGLTVKARTSNNADMSGATAWASCPALTSGQILTTGNACAHNGERYVQYYIAMTSSNAVVSPSFNEISFNWGEYPATGSLISSPFDAGDASTVIGALSWLETVPTGSGISFQMRTASSTNDAPDTWSEWLGSTDSASSYTDGDGAHVLNPLFVDGINDQWMQYKISFTSNTAVTPTISSTTLTYVVNGPPEFGGTPTASQHLGDGLVNISYSIFDADTSGTTRCPNCIEPSFEYSLDDGSSWSPITTGLSLGATSSVTVDTETPATQNITWNPRAQINGTYSSQVKIRVTAYDKEGANHTATAMTGEFVLDAKAPAFGNPGFSVIATTTPATILSAVTDDSSYEMCITLDNTETNCQSYTRVSTISLAGESDTVYAVFRDAYGNKSYASGETPAKPMNLIIKDVSNVAANPSEYQEFIVWKVVDQPFQRYEIWRSVNGGAYSWVKNIADRAMNYYYDPGLINGTTYRYKLSVVDENGNTSVFSDSVYDDPDNAGEVRSNAPIITDGPDANPNTQSVVITWSTDVLSTSVVNYSAVVSTYASTTGVTTLMDNADLDNMGEHRVVLSGLLPDTEYHYTISSTDIDGNTVTDNNDGLGHTFTTLAGPVISAVAPSLSGNTGAVIVWNTDIPADSHVFYSTTPDMSQYESVVDLNLTTAHSITLSDLATSTRYYYYVTSGIAIDDNRGDYHVLDTTNDIYPPTISGIDVPLKTDEAAIITWNTDEPATSLVRYGTTRGVYTLQSSSDSLSSHHSVTLSNLSTSTQYYYQITSVDANGNSATSDEWDFTTRNTLSEYDDDADHTAPTISAVTTISTTTQSALIGWTTDEESDSLVKYSVGDTSYASSTGSSVLVPAGAHQVSVGNLLPNTTYNYAVQSMDTAGNVRQSTGYSFTTKAGPVISAVASSTDKTSAVVTWTTDIVANSFVYYTMVSNPTLADFISAGQNDSVTAHQVNLTGLTANTEYHYYVTSGIASVDNAGLYYTLLTGRDVTAPVITVDIPSLITDVAAVVTWTTDEPATSVITYGSSTNPYSLRLSNSTLTSEHSITLSGLSTSTDYFFKVTSADIDGNTATSAEQQFQTRNTLSEYNEDADHTAPTISAVTTISTTTQSALIGWTADEDSDSLVRFSTGDTSYASSTGSSIIVPAGTQHQVYVTGLTPNTTYNYAVQSMDAAGNVRQSTGFSFTTKAGPVISAVASSTARTTATVTWTTDVSANSFVYYTAVSNPTLDDFISAGQNDSVTAHEVNLTGLSADTTYHFYVTSGIASADNSGLYYTLTTSSDLTGPVISGAEPILKTDVAAVIVWNTDELSTSKVEYGTVSGSYTEEVTSDLLTTKHSATLTDLSPDTPYFYRLSSRDADNNLGTFTELQFRTRNVLAEYDDNDDHTEPVISQVTVVSTTTQSAVISWNTNELADSLVSYSTDHSYASTTGSLDSVSGERLIYIADLEPNTIYYFTVRSQDLVGNVTVADNGYSLRTKAGPVITAVDGQGTSKTTAVVNWTTDIPADSQVFYSVSADPATFITKVGQAESVTSHEVNLTGLLPNTTYYYYVTSGIGSTVGDYGTFSTDDDHTAPVITLDEDEPSLITDRAAVVTWTTDEPATSLLRFGLSEDSYSWQIMSSLLTTVHSALLTGLSTSTPYYFKVTSVDADGNTATSSERSFTTRNTLSEYNESADHTAPTISAVTTISTTTQSALIGWTADEDSDSLVRFSTGDTSYASSTGSSIIVPAGTQHQVYVTGLTPNTTYNYAVQSMDAAGNVRQSTGFSFTTKAGPVISAVASSTARTTATVTWTTDVSANSYVFYAPTTNPADFVSVGQADAVTAHTVNILGLSANTVYYFYVTSGIASDNHAGEYYTFNTATDHLAPIISNIDRPLTTDIASVITWTTDEAATSRINYGTQSGNYTVHPTNLALTANHSVTLSGLSASTTYYYEIYSTDVDGNTATSSEGSFTTRKTLSETDGSEEETSPVISAVSVISTTTQSAVIVWDTDELSNSFVNYSANVKTYSSSTGSVIFSDNDLGEGRHVVYLTNLRPNTTYYYTVRSEDAFGNIGTNSNDGQGYTFTTKAGPVISVVDHSVTGKTTANVTWTTDVPATSYIYYSTADDLSGYITKGSDVLVTNHQIDLTGLTASTTYYFYVASGVASDNNEGSYFTFETLGDAASPTIFDINEYIITDKAAIINWKTSEPATSLLEYGQTSGNYTANVMFNSLEINHSAAFSGLASSTYYYYKITATDEDENVATSSEGVFQTKGTLSTEEELAAAVEAASREADEKTATAEANAAAANALVETLRARSSGGGGSSSRIQSLEEQLTAILSALAANKGFDVAKIITKIPSGSLEASLISLINTLSGSVPGPEIYGSPKVEVSSDSASISWKTLSPANSLVALAPAAQYDPQKVDASLKKETGDSKALTIEHSVTVDNLEPETKYVYQVRSKTPIGKEAKSVPATFVTKTEMPDVNSYNVKKVSRDRATFNWVTTVETDSQVKYTPYRNGNLAVDDAVTKKDKGMTTIHEIEIENLEAGIKYSVELSGKDAKGQIVSRRIPSFSTSDDNLPPEILQVQTESALSPGKESNVQTIISWLTNEPANGQVFYQKGAGSIDEKAWQKTVLDPNYTKKHLVVITKFAPGSIYKFKIQSSDSGGHTQTSKVYTVLTPKQTETVIDVIMKNTQDVFGWTKKLGI